MAYETDPAILFEYTNDEWEALLASIRVNRAPVPRAIICVPEERPVGLKDQAERWRALGFNDRAIAAQLNIPVAKVRLMLTGKRN